MRDVIVPGLAAYRLTRLVVKDTIWDGTRGKITAWLANVEYNGPARTKTAASKAQELMGCPFCVGVYASTLVWAAHRRGGWTRQLVEVAAVAGAAALLANVEEALGD